MLKQKISSIDKIKELIKDNDRITIDQKLFMSFMNELAKKGKMNKGKYKKILKNGRSFEFNNTIIRVV